MDISLCAIISLVVFPGGTKEYDDLINLFGLIPIQKYRISHPWKCDYLKRNIGNPGVMVLSVEDFSTLEC